MGSGAMEKLQATCAKRGRSVVDISLALFGTPQDAAKLQFRIEQGCNEMIFDLSAAPAKEVLTLLGKITELVEYQRASAV